MRLFDEIPYLEDEFLIIKKIEKRDADVLESMSQNENVRRYLPTFLFEFSYADKKKAVEEMYGKLFRNKESLMLGIFLKSEPDQMAGVCEIYNYESEWNKASLGVRLDEPYWNRKISGRCVKLMVSYLFEQTDIERITVHIMTDNTYSNRIVQGYGFHLRKKDIDEDWGYAEPVRVNKYVLEKPGACEFEKIRHIYED